MMQKNLVAQLFNESINDYSPNVKMIIKEKFRIVRGSIPRPVRNELEGRPGGNEWIMQIMEI
jgi:hypothetical protein